MRFKIDPVPITITRTCNSIEFEFIEIQDIRILIQVEFFDLNRESIYRGVLQLNTTDLNLWNQNELDLIEWIMKRFELNFSQDLPKLKRKDVLDIECEINKKRKV
jgi:hypothetical protein